MAQFGEYRVSRAHIFDTKRIHRLEEEIFPKDAYPLLGIGLLLLLPRSRNYKILAPNGEVAGFVAGSKALFEKVGWIVTLGVAKAHQQRGLGGFLLEYCEQKLKTKSVRLTVRESNFPAISLYEKMGYWQIGIYRRYYGDGENGLVMEKRLK